MPTISSYQHFFLYDLKIKHLLQQCAPKFTDGFSKSYLMKYSDKLFESLNDCRYYLQKILNDFSFLDELKESVLHLFEDMENELSLCGYDFQKLKQFYEKRFCQMRESFIDKVGTQCVGFSIFNFPPLQDAVSINELLHAVHQSITNDEGYYYTFPILEQKVTSQANQINLRGEQTPLAHDIFQMFPNDMDLGSYIEILSVNEACVLMMVRDRGHALSIEIQQENSFYYIHYFIPKICNVEMVNGLPGVSQVNDQSRFTSGTFRTTKENLSQDLIHFISCVPTDDDMIMDFHSPTK